MNIVTDPNIINQLEGGAPQMPGAPQIVSDPAMIDRLEGTQTPSNGYFASTNATPLPEFMRGTQDALSGLFGGIANLGQATANIPNAIANIPHDWFGAGPQINVANPANQIGGRQNFVQNLGVPNPSISDQIIQGIGQYAPALATEGPLAAAMAGTRVSTLPARIASSGVMGGIFGASQNPNATAGNVESGAAINAALTGAPTVIGKIAGAVRPQQYANSLISYIRNAWQQGRAMYNPVMAKVGNSNIYSVNSPMNDALLGQGNTQTLLGQYPSVINSMDKTVSGQLSDYTPDLRKLNNNFIQNPTFQNAHQLQSDLGLEIRSIQQNMAKGTASQADKNNMQNMQSAQGALLNDMHSFLQNTDSSLSQQYSNASQNWASNVMPYMSSSKISQAVKGNLSVPASDLANEFKKISGKIPVTEESSGVNVNAPPIQSQSSSLAARIAARNLAMRGLGAGIGMTALHPFGSEGLEGGMLLGGILANPSTVNAIQRVIPVSKLAAKMSGAFKKAYPYARGAILSNTGGNNGS